jgi:uncharacterized coiled-coil DUF342 family protein
MSALCRALSSAKKRKLNVGEVSDLKKQCKQVSEDICHLGQKADKLYDQAEHSRNISFVTAGNAMRRGIADKEEELKCLKAKLKEMEDALSNA